MPKKTLVTLTVVFGVMWLASNIYMQAGFAARERDGVEMAGDIAQFAIPAAGFAASFITGDFVGAGQFALGCLANLGVVTVIKQTVDAPRPNGKPHSFPSGHTAFAFHGALFIQRRYGWRYGVAAMLVAGFVAFSRVDAGMHYVRDVVAGAAIGAAAGLVFTRSLQKGMGSGKAVK